jgi:hypothetical protein
VQNIQTGPFGYIVIAIIALVPVIVWILRKTGSPVATDESGSVSARPPRTRRDELVEARDRLRRQIEILESPARRSDNGTYGWATLDRLREILQGIEAELAGSIPDNPSDPSGPRSRQTY